MFLLFVIYAALAGEPQEYIQIQTEFPLKTLEDCLATAIEVAAESTKQFPELAPYKTYVCVNEGA